MLTHTNELSSYGAMANQNKLFGISHGFCRLEIMGGWAAGECHGSSWLYIRALGAQTPLLQWPTSWVALRQ